MKRYPDSPEGVALALMDKILADEGFRSNQPPAARLLWLYQQCLETVCRDRESPTFPWRTLQ